MGKIKRYVHYGSGGGLPTSNGTWVRYESVEALEAEVERLRGAVSAKCKECEDLIAIEKGDLPAWCRNFQGHCPLLPLRPPADPGADG